MFSTLSRALLVLTLLVCASIAYPVGAVSLIDEDFSGFAGDGFSATPAPGQLDSAIWRVEGLSDTDGTFGGEHVSGDFARGVSNGGTGGGGVYAFNTGAGIALGVQPTAGDFTPGNIALRLSNTSAAVAQAVAISYTIRVFNDQPRSNSLNLEFSLDDVTWTPIPALDFLHRGSRRQRPAWGSVERSLTLSGLSIAIDDPLYLRWVSDDVSGSGSRDEFGISDVRADIVPPDLVIEKTGPAFAVAGEQIIYRIDVDNFSISDTVTNLVVTDTLPPNVTYVSDTSGAVLNPSGAGTLEWSLSDIAAGASFGFDLVVEVDAATPPGDLVNDVVAIAQINGSPVQDDSTWTTSVVEAVSIYQIQTVADPDIDDASPLAGQTVSVDGIVTAAPGELEDETFAVIQESAGGPFSGVVLNGDFSGLGLSRGDEIRVIGEISEFFSQTQINVATVEFLQAAAEPLPELLNTADLAPGAALGSEQWEGVLIEFGAVDVSDDALGFGEWLFDDGSGDARGDDLSTASTVVPALGDSYTFLRGIGWFSFGNYKVQPRDNGDFGIIPDLFTIEEIQGSGLRSPLAPPSGNDPGQIVRTEGNIVTAVGSNFFVMQSPDPVAPRGASASSGLYVFTGTAPTVSVGDEVDVQGTVFEFFDLTQIGNPEIVDIVSSGNVLPAPVVFDQSRPSADPDAPSCGVNNFECYESMRISVAEGFVTAPSQRFGSDPVAEAVVSASGSRTLRGPGVEFPGLGGTCPNCPVWSGAPEQFELDPDRLGLANVTLAGGTTFSATGILGFEFGDYEVWPTELTLNSVPDLPLPAPAGGANELTIASLNALDLFDTVQNGPRPIPACDAGYIAEDREVLTPADYQLKLDKLSGTIIDALQLPDVIGFQEVESLATLQDLSDRVAALSKGSVVYTPYLEFGNDRGNINNGFLINQARVAVDAVILEGADECLSLDNTPLHDRPTLTLEARFIAGGADWPFVVMNNHFRSLSNVDTSSRTRLKRHEQAQSVASRLQARQQADSNLPIILIGDKNSFQFTDGYVDVIGLLSGTSVVDENLVNIENAGTPGFDPNSQVSPGLVNALDTLSPDQRYSFIFGGVAQALDHALLNRAANRFVGAFGYMRGNADYWVGFEDDAGSLARSADHDGFVLVLEPGRDVDALFRDRFQAQP